MHQGNARGFFRGVFSYTAAAFGCDSDGGRRVREDAGSCSAWSPHRPLTRFQSFWNGGKRRFKRSDKRRKSS
jgi:hypothetical protein